MQFDIQVNYPDAVRTVLKAWAVDFRNFPAKDRDEAMEAFFQDLEDLAVDTAATVSVSKFFLAELAIFALKLVRTYPSAIRDSGWGAINHDAFAKAKTILEWCSGFLEFDESHQRPSVRFLEDVRGSAIVQ